jgi:putative ABC transport system permease protein
VTRPPRGAVWLLSARLAASDRDEVIGDLDEEFADVAAARGRIRAHAWYWRHAVRLAWVLGADPPLIETSTRRSAMSVDELRYAVRRLIKRPGATVASVVTLACAIGAGVAAWSLLSAVLLRPLPIPDADRLVMVGTRSTSAPPTAPWSYAHIYPLVAAVRDTGLFERLAAGGTSSPLVTVNGASTYRQVYFGTHDFFETLGVRLQAGRGFMPEDDRVGATPVAVLSDRFWRGEMKAEPAAIGQELRVSDRPVRIVGVAPRGFRGLDLVNAPEIYIPLHVVGEVGGPGINWFAQTGTGYSPTAWVHLFGRLRPGLDASQAGARLTRAEPSLDGRGRVFALTSLSAAALAEGARPPLMQFARLLATTVGLLLLIGCLTVGMLVLMRTEARRDEFALCLAIGATRARLAAGVLVEGSLVSLAGAALAVPVSWWLIAGVRAFVLPGGVSLDLLEVPFDWRTLGIAAAAAATATLLIALVAGVFGVTANVADALRARAGVTPRVGRRRTRAALVIAQMAIALVLLAGAGLFMRSMIAALSLNPMYDTARIATGGLSLRPPANTPEHAREFFADLRDRISRSPTVRSVALARTGPGMSGGGFLVLDGERRQVPSFTAENVVDERYFSTMGLAVVRGRDFTAEDREGAPAVAIVSESFGRFIARGGDPLGHQIRASTSRPGQPPAQIEIVGVVPDVITSVRTLEPLVIYRPLAQMGESRFPFRTIVLRAAGDPSVAVRDVLAVIRNMDSTLALPQFTTIDERIAQQMSPQRFGATVLGALGGIAALLTLFGMYVLAESMSAARRRELGVRAALGATRRQLSALVLTETTRLVGAGVAVGVLLAWLGAGLIRALLYRIEPFDPLTIATVVVAMGSLALAVTLRPALRAGLVDLARVLRED